MNEDMRIGLSPLSTEHVSEAIADEMMIDPVTGKVSYKRESDGVIVSGGSKPYTIKELAAAITTAIQNEGLTIPASDNLVVYESFDISGKTKLLSAMSISVESPLYETSCTEKGVFLRIYGEERVNAWMKYLETLNKVTVDPIVRLTLEVYESQGDVNLGYRYVTADMNFNELTFVKLTDLEDSRLSFKITGIRYPRFEMVHREMSATDYNALNEVDYNKANMTASTIDVVTYVSSLPTVSTLVNNGREIHFVGKKEESMGEGNTAIIVSEDKPQFDCIWAKVVG